MLSRDLTARDFVNLSASLFKHQLNSDYFFDGRLLNHIKRDLHIRDVLLNVYDTDGGDASFRMEINESQILPNTPQHRLHAYSKEDRCAHHIHRLYRDFSPQNQNRAPLFKSSDIIGGSDYRNSKHYNFLRELWGYGYTLAIPFGAGGRFHLVFAKKECEGDFDEKDMNVLENLHAMLQSSYAAFNELKARKEAVAVLSGRACAAPDCDIILNERFDVLGFCGNVKESLAPLCKANQDTIADMNLGFLELLFHEVGTLQETARAEFKSHLFEITPFYRKDELGFSQRYYRFSISQDTDPHSSRIVAAFRLDALTQREREVTQKVAKGLTYEETAKQLYVSLSTVRNHMQNIYRKLGISNQRQLVSLFHHAQKGDHK